ncbi:MAG: NADH-quinone oxidoreductase subunit NuoG [Ardenticatenaceae bacterium]|nr:NADH-quinone oxidoreductase subunit NuoG [Anaerolineales bacterium]MCB8917445.1 NADH-quinone oxidoreductase subunit NuoG [Ardenticatenaceae bacterium]
MSDFVTIIVNGKEVQAPKGATVVDAAKLVGVDIPVFCHHPKLEPVGMCRMCLVRVGMPVRDRATGAPVNNPDGTPQYNWGKGLQTGCTVRVAEGMAVDTTAKEVDQAREDIIEFILTSHPLDCPICDKGGECPLQNLTMRHGDGNSRFDFSMKMKLAKHVPLGELIYLDRERCIQCGRCTRFQSEVAGDPVIAFHNRGRRLEIVTNSEPGFDSIWSGNTTDICPVGALTTSDFRFGARPWELNPVASICPHCPVGCNTTMSTRPEAKSGGRRVIKRVMPRQNEAVNELWICDKGRFVHHFADHPDRLTQPLMRKEGQLVPVSWDEALQAVADRLQLHQANVAGLAGDRLSNEDLFLFQQLLRKGLKSNHLDLANPRLAGGDVTAKVGLAAGSNLQELGAGDAILVMASDLHAEAPVWWLRVKQAAERGAALVVLNARPTRLDAYARLALYYPAGEALTTAHHLLSAAKVDVEAAEDQLTAAAGMLVGANNLVVFYGGEGLSYAESDVLARTLANLLLVKNTQGQGHTGRVNNGLIAVWPHNNTQGAWDMGIRPDAAPGYKSLAEPGKGAAEIFAAVRSGDLRALYVVGTDPVGDGLLPGRGQLAFLVVQELFLTDTAKEADIVLPAQSWAEREGTYTSGERRVQRFYPAISPVGESRADWQILAQVGEKLGLGKAAFAASLVFRDLSRAVPQYKGMDYRKLAEVVKQWPDVGGEDLYYGGTAYENGSGLGQQWASEAEAKAVPLYDLPEVTAVTGRGLPVITAADVYRPGTLLNRSEIIQLRVVPPTLVLHADDAAELRIVEGDTVQAQVNGVAAALKAHVNGATLPGLALIQGLPLQPGRVAFKIERVES